MCLDVRRGPKGHNAAMDDPTLRRRSPWHWLKNRCLPVLISLAVLIAVQPVFDDESGLSDSLYPTLLAIVPFLGVFILSTRAWAVASAIAAGAALAVLAFFAHGNPEHALGGIAAPLMALVYLIAIVAISRSVFRSHALIDDRIYGGIAIYLMVGVGFAVVHNAISFHNAGSYRFAADGMALHAGGDAIVRAMDWSDALYFSFMSLTTIGYGDIVPARGAARSVVMLESICGVFIPAIFIARLAVLPRTAP